MGRSGSLGIHRRGSRLAAVQALYQMEIANKTAAETILDLQKRRTLVSTEGEGPITPENIDETLFVAIVEGVTNSLERIDSIISKALEKQRDIDRVEVLLRQILRAGTYEIMERPDIDLPLSINEYVAVTQEFFGGLEPNLVNGVLDRVASGSRSSGNTGDGEKRV